jgi:hypothetical protein
VILSGCIAPTQTIPPGSYSNPDQEGTIIVTESAINFAMRTRSGERLSGEYKLYVDPDGRIWPHQMASTDSVGSYAWWWDGTNIVRENPRDGERVHFSRTGSIEEDR